jgi:hypothetical protein
MTTQATTATLKDLPEGNLPNPGDFVFIPDTGSVGVVFASRVPASDQVSSSGHLDLPSWHIGPSLELHVLTDVSMVLPVREGTYVIAPRQVTGFVEYFFPKYVLALPQVATNELFRKYIVKFLQGGDHYYARTYFDFDDESCEIAGAYDPYLHAQLREQFDVAFNEYMLTSNADLKAALYAVTYTTLFSVEPHRAK